jgi:hypothetical protein
MRHTGILPMNLNGFSNVTEVSARRNPTAAEVRFGHGAVHYKSFPVELWLKPDGTLKRWIRSVQDGLRYYR